MVKNTMNSGTFKGFNMRKAAAVGLAAIALVCGALVTAQIEGDRGVAPVSSNGDFEVSGVEVNVAGKSANDAREAGWREAQRKGWAKLWRQSKGRGGAPALSDSRLDSIVSAIVVEEEQIGPRRYIAKLGVLFDRARAAQILGIRGNRARSAPMLVVPVMWSGGSAQVFESRTQWQKAWARFRTADSRIDYVRPTGGGSDSLLLNAGQVERRGRIWWRLILDQFGAADVVTPVARLEREWPGGPIVGKFTARFGPDNRYLESFQLRVANSNGLDNMLNEAVKRFDDIYSAALSRGTLRPDSSLVVEDPDAKEEEEETETEGIAETIVETVPGPAVTAPPPASTTTVSVQILTPDAAAITAAQGALRGVPGVSSVNIGSVAVGGTSVMRVSYNGTADGLRTALQSQGWQVQQGGNVLRISR